MKPERKLTDLTVEELKTIIDGTGEVWRHLKDLAHEADGLRYTLNHPQDKHEARLIESRRQNLAEALHGFLRWLDVERKELDK